MKSSQLLTFFIVLFLFFFSGCTEKKEFKQTVEVRPVKTIKVKSPDSGGIRYFPGRVDSGKKAVLSFRVSGTVQELRVNEGDPVSKGDIIAKLDGTDFKIAVDNQQAIFNRAKKDYLRGKKLVKEGHISRMDFDKLEAAYLSAQADLSLAKQQLAYTDLIAPFDGIIAQRHIQKFEEIQAKQKIVTLNDNDTLEIKIHLPENLIQNIKKKEGVDLLEESRVKDKIPVFAIFQSTKNNQSKKYPLTFKEISTKADANTQTFAVTYTMPKPDKIVVLPGMTASVEVDLTQYLTTNHSFYLPVSAVVADVNLKATVWVVDEDKMEVLPVSVKVGVMKDNSIQITEGLKYGQRVVVAGVPFLYKGLKVSLWKQTEQARDNIQHQCPSMMIKESDNNQNKASKEG